MKTTDFEKNVSMMNRAILTIVRYKKLYRYMVQFSDGRSESSFRRY